MEELVKDLKKLEDPVRAEHALKFFKTGPGEYGEGDVFLGCSVPQVRSVAKKYRMMQLNGLGKLLDSEFHEVRQSALFIMVYQFLSKSDESKRKEIFDLYLKKARQGRVNGWDLVDGSAPNIVGGYLKDKDRDLLYNLAETDDLWLQRISVLATFLYIKESDFEDALAIGEILVDHEHDLIHKAVGWMLREIGNRDRSVEEQFLNEHYKTMPRTMLRYAIEKFPEDLRQAYLKGTV